MKRDYIYIAVILLLSVMYSNENRERRSIKKQIRDIKIRDYEEISKDVFNTDIPIDKQDSILAEWELRHFKK